MISDVSATRLSKPLPSPGVILRLHFCRHLAFLIRGWNIYLTFASHVSTADDRVKGAQHLAGRAAARIFLKGFKLSHVGETIYFFSGAQSRKQNKSPSVKVRGKILRYVLIHFKGYTFGKDGSVVC